MNNMVENNKSMDEEKSEPKENARMVENHDKSEKELDGRDAHPTSGSKWDDLRQRAKHFSSNRYNLIIVLLCILLLVFFIIIIALAARLGSIKCIKEHECRSSECLKAAAAVASRAYDSFDPCTDFWKYSCGRWLDSNSIPPNRGSLSVSDEVRKTIYYRIRHLIDLIPHDEKSSSPRAKVKLFYRACTDVGNVEYWAKGTLKQAAEEIGGWPLIKVPMEAQWTRDNALKKLHVAYGVPVFFRIIVEPDDLDPTRNIIKLIPDGLGLPNKKYYFKPHNDTYVKAYKKFIKSFAEELGVGTQHSERLSEDIFHYEKRLADITPEPEVLMKKEMYKRLTVRQLNDISSSIAWIELIQKYFPDIVQEDTVIAVLSEQYFRELSRLISAADKGLINDYFMWRLIHTHIPHLLSKYRVVARSFSQTFEGASDISLPYEERWEFCIRLASQYAGHAIGAMYTNHYFPPKARENAEILVGKLLAALSGVTNSLPWIQDGSSHDAIQQKIASASILVGYPLPLQNDSLDSYYSTLNVQMDYLPNIRNGVLFLHAKQKELLKGRISQYNRWTVHPHDISSLYKYAGNQLVVPAGLFETSFLHTGAPLAVKYGTLAGHVANELSKMFDDRGVHYEVYGIMQNLLSNRTLKYYNDELKCLSSSLSDTSLHDVKVNPNLTLNSFISDIGGVKIAYEAYKTHAKNMDKQGELPGININNDQLFFISYAQSLCEVIRPEKLKAMKDYSERLPAQLRAVSALKQLPEFSSAFSCDKHSVMSPSHQCHIW